jgi:hypothetical protein
MLQTGLSIGRMNYTTTDGIARRWDLPGTQESLLPYTEKVKVYPVYEGKPYVARVAFAMPASSGAVLTMQPGRSG